MIALGSMRTRNASDESGKGETARIGGMPTVPTNASACDVLAGPVQVAVAGRGLGE